MKAHHLRFVLGLVSYRPLYWLARVLVVGLIGLIFLLVAESFSPQNLNIPYLSISIAYVIITEVNVLLSHLIHRFGPSLLLEYQFSVHVAVNIIVGFFAMILMFPLIEKTMGDNAPFYQLTIVYTLTFIALIILTIMVVSTARNKYLVDREIEKLREAQIASDYKVLVEQVNPHFLFNNLSVLKSLIKYDQKKAIDFTQNFTDIYRYVLQCRGKDSVQLSEEITFIKSYIALHKERIGDGLLIDLIVKPSALQKFVLPLALQILVENALKHNVASEHQPLHITIEADSDSVVVTNNINRKEVSFSSKQGLKNVCLRYKTLTDRPVTIEQNEQQFVVSLPLI
ncbi:MAG: histidine kinase [Bacteroidales bacterium]|nr:histidine kinase [Bacteroidales bacterium]